MQFLAIYAVIYIIKGKGIFSNATGYSSSFGPGDVLLLFPEPGHRYGSTTDEGMEELFLTFKGPVFDLWKRSGLLNPAQPQFHFGPISAGLKKLHGIIAETRKNATEALLPVSRVCEFLSEIHIARNAE
jgi:hypothetical protein